MGNCLLLLGLKREKRPVTLLLVGLDNAGKTTAAKGIVGDPTSEVTPTVGFAPEYLEYRGCEVTIYDLGGGAKIRPVWDKYFSEVHGVIYVVDSTAERRIEECREVLKTLLADKKIAGKPVLILANKQDVDGAMDEMDLVDGLKVEEIVNKYKCPTRVETCSALATKNRRPDKPIADGFRWLVDTIVVHYKEINARVTRDLEREREEQRRELEERKERLRQLRSQREEGNSGHRSGQSSTTQPPSPAPSCVGMGKKHQEEEEREVLAEAATVNSIPNGALPHTKRSKAERQELQELGFDSSGELGASSSSSSSSSLIKPPPPSPSNHRVILVRESNREPQEQSVTTATTTSTTTTTTTTTTATSTTTPSLNNGCHHHNTSKLDLSSDPRQSECIPIDSDDDMFDLTSPATTTHTSNSSAKANNISSRSNLELEGGSSKQAKKKSFLKRYHKTAPILSRDQEVPPQQA